MTYFWWLKVKFCCWLTSHLQKKRYTKVKILKRFVTYKDKGYIIRVISENNNIFKTSFKGERNSEIFVFWTFVDPTFTIFTSLPPVAKKKQTPLWS